MKSRKIGLLANVFFHNLIEGRLTSANKTLQRIKDEVSTKEWQRGYINALEGMLLVSKSRNDKSVLLNQLGSKEADKYRRAFSRQSKNKIQGDFDRGFFEAWVDYTKALKGSHGT